MSTARQGKIARLPFVIREELNNRLLDGEAGAKILPWLNTHPVVIKILAEDFEGLRVTDSNLSDWRLGGYADWMKRRERVDYTKEMTRVSMQLGKAAAGQINEGSAVMLSTQIMELLESVADGKREIDLEAVGALTTHLSKLRAGDDSKKIIEQNERRLRQNDQKIELLEKRFKLMQEQFLVRTLDAGVMAKVSAIAGDHSLDNAAKIAALRKVYFSDVDQLEASGDVKLPD